MMIHTEWIISFYLIVIRLGTVLMFTPIAAIKNLPVHARLFMVFMFALFISLQIPAPAYDPLSVSLVLKGLCELTNGLILSLGIYATFSIFQLTGQLIDNQMGLNAASIFNPQQQSHEALTARLLSMLAVLIFFSTDGHHRLLEGLIYSFKSIGPGEMLFFGGFKPVIQQFSLMFSLSFTIGSPIIITLLIVELIGAVLTRNMPQMNIYFLTLPIRIFLGLFLLITTLSLFGPILASLFNQLFQHWQDIMQ